MTSPSHDHYMGEEQEGRKRRHIRAGGEVCTGPYNIGSSHLLYKRILLSDPTRMARDRDKMAERILHLTLEILFRLTGEDYTVVKKTSREHCQAPVSEGWGRPLSPITGPPPHLLIHEDISDQKILELTYKMIELLTGEVPIRCQDVTVYFSMEEWEYLEEHKDLYKDVMMEVPQPLTPPVLSSEITTPERCPRPLLPQDCKQEDPNVPQDHEVDDSPAPDCVCELHLLSLGEDLPHINTTETYMRGEERCKEEIPTDNRTGDFTRSSEGCLIRSDFSADNLDITPDTNEDTPQDVIRKNLSSDPVQQVLVSASSKTNVQNQSHKRALDNETAYTGEKPYSCSECGRCFRYGLLLFRHQMVHTGEMTLSCSECGKDFTNRSSLVRHEMVHTGEKPFPCSECEKCFNRKSTLVVHLKTHTREKPFSCSECGKQYSGKYRLSKHQKIHTAEKLFSCSECEKCFTKKAYLVTHQRIHTGEKPFECSECGKCFNNKGNLVTHLKIHTGK
ncbi:oocyte zinc finger protein XlCOF7.1-like isoform X2 [Dendrobates tinctorius]|uniref:oocyte zinc finger protein XlCOF7.1-like isoform X2 n=1 Tax=Dendrobates tinctorius TaxID=92724 RepID=UPI003CC99351